MSLRRLVLPLAATLVAAVAALVVERGAPTAASGTAPRLTGLAVGNGGAPFAGDRRLLATVSPNADGLRDRAFVRFSLNERARVVLQALRARSRAAPPKLVWQRVWRLSPGRHRLAWQPDPSLEPRTYLLRLVATDLAGNRRIYGRLTPSDRSALPGPVVRVLGVDAGFTRRSYLPGARARLAVETDARRLTLQAFRAGPETVRTVGNMTMEGVPVGNATAVSWTGRRGRRVVIPFRIGRWESGLYFVRATADDGRVGFAPFVLRPRVLGTRRVAIVMPTNTWQAYNHRDVDGDGWGDTWYAVNSIPRVDLTRPYLNRGVPPSYRVYNLGFLRWFYQTGKRADFLTDEHLGNGRTLAARYTLLIFLGYHEYSTPTQYSAVRRYRDLGGNMMFLSATNFLWRVHMRGQAIYRANLWRNLGRPEAAVVGVQYLSNDGGRNQGRYVVTGARIAPWVFAGTGLRNGDRFGRGGIEIDARSSASPPGTKVLAAMPNLHGPGKTAEMTYYTTRRGAKVFAAGTLSFGGGISSAPVRRLVENLWARLSRP